MSKRLNYISWDEYFMGIALLSAQRSKDPSTQVGACIVNQRNKIVGAGYNGLPAGCDDDQFPWHREGNLLDTKYPYVCHAELNAILNNIGIDLHGCRLYTSLFPCNECAKAIVQAGIVEVVYLSNKYADSEVNIASRKMLDAAGITCRRMESHLQKITLAFLSE
jgi:dCMP deaminase